MAQQQPDGGFEVAAFPGFETPDAVLAIAEAAQTGTDVEHERGARRGRRGASTTAAAATPLDALDDYAADDHDAGEAGKIIVLGAAPLGLDPTAFDPAGDGSPVDLVARWAATTTTEAAFNNLLYVVLGQDLRVRRAQPAILGRSPAPPSRPTAGGTSSATRPAPIVDLDTTALAVEALRRRRRRLGRPMPSEALGFFAANQQANGAWQSFGADDPNSTALAIFGITALGFDVESPCWRDTADASLAGSDVREPDGMAALAAVDQPRERRRPHRQPERQLRPEHVRHVADGGGAAPFVAAGAARRRADVRGAGDADDAGRRSDRTRPWSRRWR